ncbi:MAG: N-acetylglucosamine-6-phosphate deacetylase [Clostridia bacterium]|nr:N-acetylglucosamine-6-phosphate deacetylase [Clostridia bacterium]
MKMLIKNVKVHQRDGSFAEGEIYVENGRIAAPCDVDEVVDGGGALLCPGLLDIHTHGRAGGDYCEADEDMMLKMAADYAKNGVTTVLPTLASDTTENWKKALSRIAACNSPSYIGIHIEGSWLSLKKRGAHAPDLLRTPTVAELSELCDASPLPILKVSAAPECDADGSFIAACRENGIRFSIAHTEADYQTAMEALARGADCFTHLYNAMMPLHHREGGPVAAALTEDGAYVELICDGMHIAPEMVRLAYRCKGADRFILVSDSMAGTGCPDGTYEIAGQPAIVKDGMALTLDGHLAGSTLNLLKGVQNLAAFCHISFGQALLSATRTPAAYLGMETEYGTLAVGAHANLFLLPCETADAPTRVMQNGKWLL